MIIIHEFNLMKWPNSKRFIQVKEKVKTQVCNVLKIITQIQLQTNPKATKIVLQDTNMKRGQLLMVIKVQVLKIFRKIKY